MKKFTIQQEISTPKELSGAYYEIIREGQNLPSKNDYVRVVLNLNLPTNSNKNLLPKLVFQSKVVIFGEPLNYNWGYHNTDVRTKNMNFDGENWKLAFDNAREYAEIELEKLETALVVRENSLKNADFYEE